MIDAFAVVNGVHEKGGFYIGIYNRDTNAFLTRYKVNNCTKFNTRIKAWVEKKSLELHYKIVEWR